MITANGTFNSFGGFLPDTAMGAVDYLCIFVQLGTLVQFLHTATPKVGGGTPLQWVTTTINLATLLDDAAAKILLEYPDGYKVEPKLVF